MYLQPLMLKNCEIMQQQQKARSKNNNVVGVDTMIYCSILASLELKLLYKSIWK